LTEFYKCPLNFIFKFSTLILTEKLLSHFFTVAETLDSDKSDSNQQRSATLECFLQMLTTMRVRAFFSLQLQPCVCKKCPILLGTVRAVVLVLNFTEFKKYLKIREFY